jgi:BirA family transcriptional regulator, biotin operon repressor / biotin---[acetyl-CoA-carboxylase] ligase
VLVEASPERRNPAFIIGIGLNLSRPADWPEELAAISASLDEAGLDISREALLAALLRQLHVCLGRFGEQGFGALSDAWNAHNALLGLPVTLSADHRQLRGLCGTGSTPTAPCI